ncbi:MAG: M48 family metallopeptidase [Proteobacteria bacterium]|nr:M48 family metallopeptidase [Pseudomonadota bacterium]MBU1386324.1 M48 family metallopeptidase [Pseudomonadota bacterium]MBU1543928.1 M48 family metallopeptidase [Pseudomonadota bacterium]MBU2429886.1 M48 family metallopeptidase [Pseudomonadota bacterium]MBU2482093.1 M48 family metallopeptidase [Pseudomonadota bacterium]
MFGFTQKKQCHTPLIEIEGYGIKIIRKNIRHIYFKLDPRTKTMIVSAPKQIGTDQLNQVILSKTQWVLKQVSKPSESKINIKEDVSFDKPVLFLGRKYPVRIFYQTGHPFIEKTEQYLAVYIHPDARISDIQDLLDTWYRKELKRLIVPIIEKWQPVLNVQIKEFNVKKMKTRWGSCNIKACRIWLNFYLIKLDHRLLEYVVVHEMAHLLEKGHNARFKNLMTQFIPQWPEYKKQLNQYML